MRKPNLLETAALVLLAIFLAGPAEAQSDLQALEDHMREFRGKVVQKRDSALNVLLEMTDEQAKAFWPLQKAYDKELKKLGKSERSVMVDFAKVFDALTADAAT